MPGKVGFVSNVSVGQIGSVEHVVRPEHAADRFENAGVTVLATPVLCHWFESAAVRAIAQELEPGEASVGTRISIEHFKASKPLTGWLDAHVGPSRLPARPGR